jgi:hypothetical protein
MYRSSPKESWPKEGGGNGFQTIEVGKIVCNETNLFPESENYERYACRLNLPHEHWHKILVIDGRAVIDWEKECPT